MDAATTGRGMTDFCFLWKGLSVVILLQTIITISLQWEK